MPRSRSSRDACQKIAAMPLTATSRRRQPSRRRGHRQWSRTSSPPQSRPRARSRGLLDLIYIEVSFIVRCLTLRLLLRGVADQGQCLRRRGGLGPLPWCCLQLLDMKMILRHHHHHHLQWTRAELQKIRREERRTLRRHLRRMAAALLQRPVMVTNPKARRLKSLQCLRVILMVDLQVPLHLHLPLHHPQAPRALMTTAKARRRRKRRRRARSGSTSLPTRSRLVRSSLASGLTL